MAEPNQPSSGEGRDANAIYSLGASEGERARLQRQADELRPDSAALLEQVDLRPGQSAIDLGCGPRGVLDLLAERVSPNGRLVRPGGRVASMESDMEFWLCYPPHPAFTRLCEIFTVVFSRNGADPQLGRKVPQLFRDAGLTDVEVEARAPLYPQGHSRRTIRLDLVRAMRPQVLGWGSPVASSSMGWTPQPVRTSLTPAQSSSQASPS